MAKEDSGSPWRGWRPTTKKYDPNDPHFNPMHPPPGYPKELLEAEWGEGESISIIHDFAARKIREFGPHGKEEVTDMPPDMKPTGE